MSDYNVNGGYGTNPPIPAPNPPAPSEGKGQ
jgi:hypothetical protein